MMNILRQLRWQLTLSYTVVTVSAFLVILLIMGGIVFTRMFVPVNFLNPEQMIEVYLGGGSSDSYSNYLLWSQVLSQSPVDLELVRLLLNDPQSVITYSELFRIGAVQVSASTKASIRMLIFGADGTLLGTSAHDDPILLAAVGQPYDPLQVPGLEGPFKSAMAGVTEAKRLYTTIEPNRRYVFAAPVFNRAGGDEIQVVGAIAIIFDAVPTQADVPAHILKAAGRGLLIFLIGVGIMGAIFGAYFAHGLSSRFKRIAATTDQWSEGDFSRYIDDNTGDEISQITQRLNHMAKQLQGLLRRRQDMAVSEERNRLARDLHDSAKQQALAASLELGAALTLYERDPAGAKKHLAEADALVDTVRKELTNLVDELRPHLIDGEDFSEILREHAVEWSQRSGIELDTHLEENEELSPERRETLFRIAQEALANIERHSAARRAEIRLEYDADRVTMVIKDDGRGFDTRVAHGGLGLRSMRERAEALGGSFLGESAPGKGTQIAVTLPKADQD